MALVTKTEVKDYLRLDKYSTAEDAFLDDLIAAAQAEMEVKHGRRLEYQSSIVEKYNGQGEAQLFLKCYPVVSVTQVKVDGTVLNSTNYDIDPEKGILYGCWEEGFQNIEVTYSAGYWTDKATNPPAGVSRLPADIHHECLELIAYLYENRGGRR